MYEEHWAERQEKSFVKWLNYELTGGDWCFAGKTTGSSFNQFSESLKRQHVVHAASRMYQSEDVEVVLRKLVPVRLLRFMIKTASLFRKSTQVESPFGRIVMLLQTLACVKN
jgi:hypothetical protein